MRVSYSEYELYPLGSLNSKSIHTTKRGALLRLEDNGVGYADLCPLSEYGDGTIEQQLESLVQRRPKLLMARSLFLALRDLEARAANKNLFSDYKVRNHYFVRDLLSLDLKEIPQIIEKGYRHFKIKMGRELQLETAMLKELMAGLKELDLGMSSLRLDFNSSSNQSDFEKFLKSFSGDEIKAIDFIEDPYPYSPQGWQNAQDEFSVRLAADLDIAALQSAGKGFEVLIVKPARQDGLMLSQMFKDKKFVLTHSQDFLVGQLHALAEAHALLEKGVQVETCGLQLIDTFEPSSFQSLVEYDGDLILPPQSGGIGLDKELEAQEWKPLI